MNVKILKTKYSFICICFLFIPSVNATSTGEQLYMKNCMVCHADDGSGAMPGVVNLEEDRAWSTLNEEILLKRLKQGIQKQDGSIGMPAMGGNPNLTDKELKEMIRYMRQTFIK